MSFGVSMVVYGMPKYLLRIIIVGSRRSAAHLQQGAGIGRANPDMPSGQAMVCVRDRRQWQNRTSKLQSLSMPGPILPRDDLQIAALLACTAPEHDGLTEGTLAGKRP